MRFNVIDRTQVVTSAFTVASDPLDIAFTGGDCFSSTCNVFVDTPPNKTFSSSAVDLTQDVIVVPMHGFPLGLRVTISNPGTLPGGILASTPYFVIPTTLSSFKLAISLTNAQSGIAINLTSQGTGTNTVNVSPLAGANLRLQQTNDPLFEAAWTDVGIPQTFTGRSTFYFEKDRPSCRYLRLLLTMTSGHVTMVSSVLVKGDKQ